MSDTPGQPAPGWYYAQGDPANTQRYWDGSSWQGGPQPIATPGNPMQNPIGYGVGTSSDGEPWPNPWPALGARIIDAIIWIFIFMILAVTLGGGSAAVGNSDFGGRRLDSRASSERSSPRRTRC